MLGRDPFRRAFAEAMEAWDYYCIGLMGAVFKIYDPSRDCLRCATDDEEGLKDELEKYLPAHCAFFGLPKSEHDLKITAEILAMFSRRELADLMFLTVDRQLGKALSAVLPSVTRDHPGKVMTINHQLLRKGG